MSIRVHGYTINNQLLFKLDGQVLELEGTRVTLVFGHALPVNAGVLAEIAVMIGGVQQFRVPLDHAAILDASFTQFSGLDTTDVAPALLAEIHTDAPLLFMLQFDDDLLEHADTTEASLAFPTSVLSGVVAEDLAYFASIAAGRADFFDLLRLTQADTYQEHLEYLLGLRDVPKWDVTPPYIFCLIWLISKLLTTSVFCTPNYEFTLRDNTVSWRLQPTLLPRFAPSVN